LHVRIIPRLDIKGPNLVKGIHLEGLRVLGKPEDFARYYYETGADELIYMDAVASLYGRNSLLGIVEKTAREIFIPLTVGGGLRSLDDIRTVLRAGADKVSLNTAVIKTPQLIREASLAFGSSTIMVSIEAMRRPDGSYEAYVDFGREKTGVDAFQWALRATELGAGELVVTSIDREGTGRGFDLELSRKIAESVPIPVIASGGAGSAAHVAEVIVEGKADAVAIASLVHYHFVRECRYSAKDFQEEGNIEFLRRGASISRIEPASLAEIKGHLTQCGIECRMC
jgi:imidazole glycerol-phosphate synthase subunit HisF